MLSDQLCACLCRTDPRMSKKVEIDNSPKRGLAARINTATDTTILYGHFYATKKFTLAMFFEGARVVAFDSLLY